MANILDSLRQNDLVKTVAKVAPGLATALGGPFAGLAVQALGAALGINEPTQDKLTEALQGPLTGDQIVAIRTAEQALKVRLRELDIREDEVFLQDKQSARTRDAEFIKAGMRNVRADRLAYLAIGGLLMCLGCIFGISFTEYKIDPESEKLLYLLTGAMIALTKDVYSFEFGSSKDSARQSQAMADALKNGNGNGNGNGNH